MLELYVFCYRNQYKYKVVEILIEICVPLLVLGIGFFASITALKTITPASFS